jgi:hypothetical protein
VEILSGPSIGGPDPAVELFNGFQEIALWYYDQIRDRGPWDFKYRDPAVNEGKRSRYEAFGNFNYGAAGAAAGS